eukprot:Ihof_evm24s2 gene=Ihof_evmTU24s2
MFQRDRFGGIAVEEILQRGIPDILQPGLSVVFVGINPGLSSAYEGHNYAGTNNDFWPLLYESGLVPARLTYKDDTRCPALGFGFTNIVPRTTRSQSDLSKKEIKEGGIDLQQRLAYYAPEMVCFIGKGIYEIFSGKKCELGLQKELFP